MRQSGNKADSCTSAGERSHTICISGAQSGNKQRFLERDMLNTLCAGCSRAKQLFENTGFGTQGRLKWLFNHLQAKCQPPEVFV